MGLDSVSDDVINRFERKAQLGHNDASETITGVSPDFARPKDTNVDVRVNPSELTPQLQELLDATLEFTAQSSYAFQKKFWDEIKEYEANHPGLISEKMKDVIKKRGFDKPRFRIMYGEEALDFMQAQYYHDDLFRGDQDELVERHKQDYSRIVKHSDDGIYGYTADKNSLYVVFQLPKPLQQFWKKGGSRWGERAIDIHSMFIEWGHFYRECLPVIWAEQENQEDKHNLDFTRLNRHGEHENDYYYFWQIRHSEHMGTKHLYKSKKALQ